jgi:hypothetical protein
MTETVARESTSDPLEPRSGRADASARDIDSVIARALTLAVCLLIPLRILAEGYLPQDDALRHAAKAVAGRDWSEILLHRPGVLDFSPGWHALLTLVHSITGADQHTLLNVGIVSLFLVFSVGPALLLRRAEAWLAALAVVALVEPQIVFRLMLGRPFILSAAVAITICLTWARLDDSRPPRGVIVVLGLLIAAATWIHGSWYLFALPVIAFVVGGRRRVAQRLLLATVIGVGVGALLTGAPFAFLWQNLSLALNIGGGGVSASVFELQPYPGAPLMVVTVAALIIIRKVWRGEPARSLAYDPVFILGALGWLLGLKSARFWMDWGTPAIVVFIALEIEALWIAAPSRRGRLIGAAVAALACFLVWTGNVNGRWNTPTPMPFRLMLAPERAATLPDSGGILYSDDKRAFYDLFFLRPNAPWRYSTGYAPELMTPEDYAVYTNRGSQGIEALEPWIRRMRPADRMVLRDDRGIPPWRWLQWQSLGGNFWVGRLPRP